MQGLITYFVCLFHLCSPAWPRLELLAEGDYLAATSRNPQTLAVPISTSEPKRNERGKD